MGKCIVKNCSNYYGKRTVDKTIKYFSFPKDVKLLSEWLRVCDFQDTFDWNQCFVCSEHFEETDYALKGILLNLPMSKRHLKKDAVPTKNIVISDKRRREINMEKIKENKKLVEEALKSYEESSKEEEHVMVEGTQETSQMTIALEIETTEVEGNQTKETLSKAVQTEIDIECAREFHIMTLEAQLRKYKSAYKNLQKERNSDANLNLKLKKMFTPAQLRKITEPDKKIKWKGEDMSSAIALYSAGPRCYNLLRHRGYPLPCPSTLTKWSAKLKLMQEINQTSKLDT